MATVGRPSRNRKNLARLRRVGRALLARRPPVPCRILARLPHEPCGFSLRAKTPDDAVASTAVEISEINFALFKVSYLSFLFLAVITDTA